MNICLYDKIEYNRPNKRGKINFDYVVTKLKFNKYNVIRHGSRRIARVTFFFFLKNRFLYARTARHHTHTHMPPILLQRWALIFFFKTRN